MRYSNDRHVQIQNTAKGIISELLDLYNKEIIPNKYFHELVLDRVKSNSIDYKYQILIETIRLIPYNLNISTNKQCIFIATEEY